MGNGKMTCLHKVYYKIGKYQYNYHAKRNRVINAIIKNIIFRTFGSIDYQKVKHHNNRNKVKMLMKYKLGDDLIKNVDTHNIIDTPLLVYCHNLNVVLLKN